MLRGTRAGAAAVAALAVLTALADAAALTVARHQAVHFQRDSFSGAGPIAVGSIWGIGTELQADRSFTLKGWRVIGSGPCLVDLRWIPLGAAGAVGSLPLDESHLGWEATGRHYTPNTARQLTFVVRTASEGVCHISKLELHVRNGLWTGDVSVRADDGTTADRNTSPQPVRDLDIHP